MSPKEAKEILNAMGGVLVLCKIKTLLEEGSNPFGEITSKYMEAVEVASQALDIMDHQIEIESGEDNN